MRDRYLKFILTVIAAELLWIGVKDLGPTVSAQAGQQPMPVVIRGIEVQGATAGALPVYTTMPLRIQAETALPVSVGGLVQVEVGRPVEVFTQRPLLVQSVPYTPSEKPGE